MNDYAITLLAQEARVIVRDREWMGWGAGAVFSAVVLLVTVFALNGPPARALPPAAPDIVAIDSGSLHGVSAQHYRLFNGIPYAAPPVGALRWRPPAPVSPWTGIREARDAGPKCAQATGAGGLRSTDEDCLYLNVWTPRTLPADGRGLPVMVWIHGGSLQTGTGSMYGAAPLVSQPDGDSIVVTINYRLGTFGFLAASALDEGAGSGDYGLMDQQAALRWVQRNIAAFGGDPDRVTVDGESAGGISICAQMAAPSSAGLFAAAMMQSGPCAGQALPEAEAEGDAWASGAGCAGADAAACLRGLSADVLVDHAPDSANVVYGNDFLPRDPVAVLKAGGMAHVPTFIGSNHDEMALWVWIKYGNPLGAGMTAADYPNLLTTQLSGVDQAQVDRIVGEYPLGDYAQPALALTRAWTDKVVCNLVDQAGQFGRQNPTYIYEFDDRGALAPPSNFPMGAYHAAELPSLFDLAQVGWLLHGAMTPDQQRLQDEMRRYWTRFITAGSADPQGLPAIPRYSESAPAFLSFRPAGNQFSEAFAADHRCEFWSSLAR
ncbi:carboxylesterase/lipase family protein [Nocardia aurantiaca]|uniref:carboxylesterase/lipase family protein n=1 Tax=Nocardia aurantiaca TaxID=2675850 RepID=UPI0018AC6719|nr:carboxylesterase family protein [Nocardia aurantiaca]